MYQQLVVWTLSAAGDCCGSGSRLQEAVCGRRTSPTVGLGREFQWGSAECTLETGGTGDMCLCVRLRVCVCFVFVCEKRVIVCPCFCASLSLCVYVCVYVCVSVRISKGLALTLSVFFGCQFPERIVSLSSHDTMLCVVMKDGAVRLCDPNTSGPGSTSGSGSGSRQRKEHQDLLAGSFACAERFVASVSLTLERMRPHQCHVLFNFSPSWNTI